ncbi:predicted protein, partial [Nematostella vectensis]
MADVEQVQVRFFTKQKKYEIADTPFSLSANIGHGDLNDLINGLLGAGNVGQSIQFDFLIDSQYLQDTIQKHMKAKEISAESVVEIEYLEKHPAPQPDNILVHDDWVSSVSRCKNCIITGSYDNCVQIWDDQGSCLAKVKGHTSPVKDVEWVSKDEQKGVFLSSSQDQSIRVMEWSIGSGEASCVHVCKGHTQSVDSISINPSATKFCSGSWDKTLKLWSAVVNPEGGDEGENGSLSKKQKTTGVKKKATTRTPLMTFTGHTQAVSSVVWMDRTTICSAGWDHCIRLWDAESGVNKQTLTGSKVFCEIAYSALNQCLASGSADKYIRLWDHRAEDGQVVRGILTSHQGWVSSVSWSPSNQFELASASYDTTVKIWDTRSPYTPLYTLTGHQDKVMCVRWSSSRHLMSGGTDNQLILY